MSDGSLERNSCSETRNAINMENLELTQDFFGSLQLETKLSALL